MYDGDANDLTSTSAPVILTVNKIATTIVVLSSMNPSIFGQQITFTGTVSPAAATGTVSFYADSLLLGTGTISAGTANFMTSTLSAGVHSITATYSGDSDYLTGTSTALTQTVKRIPTVTGLTTSPNPSRVGQNVKLTASVSPAAVTGSVTFYDGATAIASRTLSGGVAAFNTTALVSGTHALKAVYNGNADDAPSTSPVVSQVVQ